MAFGIPCIGFDLDSYKSYYPHGMLKVRVGGIEGFANMILELLNSDNRRNTLGKKAQKMIKENWSWDQRVNQLLNVLK